MIKNWISSPFSINILKSLYGKNTNNSFTVKANVNEFLKQFIIKNNLFKLKSNGGFMLEKSNIFNVQTTAFTSHKETISAFMNWIHQYGDFRLFNPDKYLLPNTEALLSNICMYKGIWKNSKNHVSVHNSFSYTEDIKYEVRVLVVPMSSDHVKLVIIVPNETDVLHHLITKLHREGLSAALSSIQPSFTATCKQALPTFGFTSTITIQDVENGKLVLSQYGEVKVDECGVNIKVLTCLPVCNDGVASYEKPIISNDCFNFAIVCKDVPIFTGQVVP